MIFVRFWSTNHIKSQIASLFILAIFVNLFIYSSSYAKSNALVADLSQSDISINTDFNGASLLLFGSISGEIGDDIIVLISGPSSEVVTRQKSYMGGIWVNSNSVTWKNVPSYYQIFTTKPLSQIASRDVLKSLVVGTEFLNLRYDSIEYLDTDAYNMWAEALKRNMQSASLWKTNETTVQVMRGALFRTQVSLPANITTGDYEARIIHFRQGKFIAEDRTAIAVKKAGFSAIIYNLAHEYSIFYGIFAVVFAIFAGWLAAAIFPKP